MQADQGGHGGFASLAMDVQADSLGRAIEHLDLPIIELQAELIFCQR